MYLPGEWGIPHYMDFHAYLEKGKKRQPWRGRSEGNASSALQNQLETRRFLAEVVYGVSEDLLDDVIRVRMSDLRVG